MADLFRQTGAETCFAALFVWHDSPPALAWSMVVSPPAPVPAMGA
jgi:hypothetical protein